MRERETEYCNDWHHVAIHLFWALFFRLLSPRPDTEYVINPALSTGWRLNWLTIYSADCFSPTDPWVPNFCHNTLTFLLPAQFTWFTHAIHMAFPLSFVYLKTQFYILFTESTLAGCQGSLCKSILLFFGELRWCISYLTVCNWKKCHNVFSFFVLIAYQRYWVT